MVRPQWVMLIALLLLGLPSFLALPSKVRAATLPSTVPVQSIAEQRLDSGVTKTTIITSFATAHDIVDVYNYVPVARSRNWRKATSMDHATWVFRPGGGSPKLAIFFSVAHGEHIAKVYDDQFDEGAVPVAVSNGHVVLTHPMHWSLRAVSLGPWYLPDGRISDQLYIEGAFSLPNEAGSSSELAHHWRGHDAWDYTLSDPRGSGVPEYGLLRLFPFVNAVSNVPRTDLILNVERYHVQGFEQAIFWPYLGSQQIRDRTWFNYAPPLQMDWKKGQLVNLASFLPDSEPENGEQIFSVYPFHRHGTNVADFENPFAYYRFDPGHTGFPNLIIRSYFFPAGDIYRQYGGTPLPAEFIRYSWGNGNGLMLYKVGLLGRYPAQSLVAVGKAAIKTMDYGTFPAWIMSHVWDFATFVANEKGGFRSSEGIYEWDQAPGLFDYAYGYRGRIPLHYYRLIAPGYRGEINPAVTTVMRLYVSKVDGRLHSLGATQGLWNVDGNQLIRTGTLDGEHVGEWHRFVAGREVESLYHVPGWLLYSADGQIVMEQVARGLNSEPLSPPVSEVTLQALRNALPAHQPDIAARGLSAMLPVSAPTLSLDGGGLQDVVETSAGWHAELLPAPTVALVVGHGFPLASAAALRVALHCGEPQIAGGKTLFMCRPPVIDPVKLSFDGAWHADRLTPAAVKIVRVQVGTTGATAPYAEQPISIVVANHGQAIARDVRLAVWAQQKGYSRVALTNLVVTIPGEQQQDLQFDWLPGRPGDWTVQVLLEPAATAADRTVQEADAHLLIRQASLPSWWKLGPIPSGRLIGEAFVLLGCGSVFAAGTVLYLTRRRSF